MQKLIRPFVGLSAAGIAGVVVALLAMPVMAGSAQTVRAHHSSATIVNVSAVEFAFKLSKKKVPTGKVTFHVTNHGKIAHDFKIAGKKTPLLKPGKSANITVNFTKSGRVAYTCTVPGHAAAGMKGVLAVGKATVPPPTTQTTTTTPTTTTTTGPPPGATVINVSANEFVFQLSQTSAPVNTTVFFNVTNVGRIAHDFTIPSLGVTTPVIQPGQTAGVAVTFKAAGQLYYDCDLPQHAEAGMYGYFTVTG